MIPELKESFRPKILFFAILIAAGTIPLYNNLNSIAMIFFVFACVIGQPAAISLNRLQRSLLWTLPVIFFLIFLCSYFWDVTGGYAVRDIERYASLLFIPPAMAIMPALSRRFVRITCMFFMLVTLVVCLLCLGKSMLEYTQNGDYRVFYYHYLSMQMDLNAVFLSNYCLASVIWLLYFGVLQRKKISGIVFFMICAALVFLFGMILLLSSKLIIFLTMVMLVAFILYIGYSKGFFLKSFLVIGAIIIAGIVGINKLSYLKWRVDSVSLKKYSGQEDDNNGLSIRRLMWGNAWDLISKRPLTGYGIRGAKQKVLEVYRKENFELGYSAGYHSHNQYLESALMGGVTAFILFVAMIFWAGGVAIRTGNVLLFFMLLHFACQSLIESTYEVQQEQLFYIFFIFLFYYQSPSPQKTIGKLK